MVGKAAIVIRHLRSLARDRAGAAVIELCFVAPMLVVMICAVSDASIGFTRRLQLQQAAGRSVEMALAAGLTSATATNVQNEAASAGGVPTNQVAVDTWLECAGVRQTNISDICATGSPARFISVTITDTYSSAFGSMLQTLGAGNWGSVGLRGFAEVRVQ